MSGTWNFVSKKKKKLLAKWIILCHTHTHRHRHTCNHMVILLHLTSTVNVTEWKNVIDLHHVSETNMVIEYWLVVIDIDCNGPKKKIELYHFIWLILIFCCCRRRFPATFNQWSKYLLSKFQQQQQRKSISEV